MKRSMKTSSLDVFGPRVRSLREKRGLTQEQLAKRVGMDRAHLTRLENGQALNPGLRCIEALARGLGVRPSSLLDA